MFTVTQRSKTSASDGCGYCVNSEPDQPIPEINAVNSYKATPGIMANLDYFRRLHRQGGIDYSLVNQQKAFIDQERLTGAGLPAIDLICP